MFDYDTFVPDDVEVRWKPLTNGDPIGNPTSQEAALESNASEIMLTGGRGWGKTDVQLVRFLQNVGVGYGSYWRGIIFDREYKNLDDLVVKSRRLFIGTGARFLESTIQYKWVWPTGEELLFRTAKTENDYWSFHGHEYPFIGWNELTKYPDGRLYQAMLSTNRSGFDPVEHTPKIKTDKEATKLVEQYSKFSDAKPLRVGDYATVDGQPLAPIPLEVVSTTNPWGVGHHWVKAAFIDPAPYGRMTRIERAVFDPKLKETRIITRTRVTFFGTYRENPYLSPEYILGLFQNANENMVKAWVRGDWNIVAGGAFDDVWDTTTHVIPRVSVPAGYALDHTFDWGSTHPYAFGVWAESNGEELVFPDGKRWSPPPGSLIQIAELYGSKTIGSNVGLQSSPKDIAIAITELEATLRADGWISGTIWPGPADNQIRNVTRTDVDTIEKVMSDNGVDFELSDKSAGSRKAGFELMRQRMRNARAGEGPGIYFMDNCRASVATIPVLPRDEKDPDDIDTSAEDHAYDHARYRCLKGNNRVMTTLPVRFAR